MSIGTSNFALLCSTKAATRFAKHVPHGNTWLIKDPPPDAESWSANRRGIDLNVILPGSIVDDLVWTWQNELLIQDNVLELFRSLQFTGFFTRRASARFKRVGGAPPPLQEVVVTGWGGMAAESSGFRLLEYYAPGRYSRYVGMTDPAKMIDEKQWDGSDLFMVWPLPKYIFITKRVAVALKDAGFRGYSVYSLSEIKFATRDGSVSPGVLSNYMPLSIARLRGEAAGIPTI